MRPLVFEAQTLVPRANNDKLDIDEPCGETTLVGKWEFESTWTFTRNLCKTHVWYMRFFSLSSSMRVLGKLRPLECVVRELTPGDGMPLALRFWNGQADIDAAKWLEQRQLGRRYLKSARAGFGLTNKYIYIYIYIYI